MNIENLNDKVTLVKGLKKDYKIVERLNHFVILAENQELKLPTNNGSFSPTFPSKENAISYLKLVKSCGG
jgi:hypothetical protein